MNILSKLPPSSTLDASIASFMSEKRTGNFSVDHLRTLHGRLLQFAKHFGGHRHIQKITRDELLKYLPTLGTHRTQINHRDSIRLLFEWAKTAKQWLPLDRDTPPHTISIQAGKHDPEFYTPAEMQQLLRAACNLPKEQHCIIVFLVLSAFCGIRTKEMTRLRWVDIKFKNKVVSLGSLVTKTSLRRAVPIPDNAAEWLDLAIGESQRNGLVIPEHWHQNLHRLTGAVADAAGLVWKLNGLRHSFGTYAMAKHQNSALVSEIMGNSPGVLQSHYKGLALASDADEWFGITPDNTL